MRNPISLHNHSHYSLLDGIGTVAEYLILCKKYGLPSLALTEHGNLNSSGELLTECKKEKIKPILGIEAYLTKDVKIRGKRTKNYHVVLLAKNKKGFDNLLKINGFAQTEGFYYRPRIDMSVLEKYHEGLICMGACIAGLPAASKNPEKIIMRFKKIFGDDYYLEFIPLETKDVIEANFRMLELAKKTKTKIVLTQDMHYAVKEDFELQEISLAIRQNVSLEKLRNDKKYFKISSKLLYYRTSKELWNFIKTAYPKHQLLTVEKFKEMINMSWEINSKIEHIKIDTSPKLPKVNFDGQDSYSYIKNLIKKGLKERVLSADKQIYIDRIKKELKLIKKYDFIDYFAIVADLVDYCRKSNILPGPGRGSGASALILYLTGISDLDPIKYDFVMERFISESRLKTGEIPDIDIDVPDIYRQQVIEHLYEKYGRENVSPIGALGTFQFRVVFKDLVRCYSMDYEEANIISKMLFTEFPSQDQGKLELNEFSMEEFFAFDTPGIQRLKRFLEKNPLIKEKLFKFRGRVRHFTKHAAGIVITPKPLANMIPVMRHKNEILTGWVEGGRKRELSYFGFLKLDILGLKNMTNIDSALKLIKSVYNKDINIRDLPVDDPKILRQFTKGNTAGIFQFEGDPIRHFMKRVQVDSFDDLMAVNALYRPGPLISGFSESFIKNKFNKSEIKYLPGTKEVLGKTYNCIIYQEDLMKIVNKLADFDMDETNDFRKALLKRDYYVDKKRFEQLEKYKNMFVSRSAKKIGKKEAEDLYTQMEKFITYGFNKSHAAGYALIAYWCMYLKYYYTHEFLTSILNSNIKNHDRTVLYIYLAKRLGIEILPPDIDKSDVEFKLEGKSIRFPLTGVKKVGENAVKEIKAKRPFKDFDDFCSRITRRTVRKDCIQNLIKMNTFKRFGDANKIYNKFLKCEEEWKQSDLTKFERELLGFYLQRHPMDRVRTRIRKSKNIDVKKLKRLNAFEKQEVLQGDYIFCIAIINNVQVKYYKKQGGGDSKGRKTIYLELDDGFSRKIAIVYDYVYRRYEDLLIPGKIILFKTTVDAKNRIAFADTRASNTQCYVESIKKFL